MLLMVFVIFAACLVFGGAFVLLRTAKTPKLPDNYTKREDDDDDDSSGW